MRKRFNFSVHDLFRRKRKVFECRTFLKWTKRVQNVFCPHSITKLEFFQSRRISDFRNIMHTSEIVVTKSFESLCLGKVPQMFRPLIPKIYKVFNLVEIFYSFQAANQGTFPENDHLKLLTIVFHEVFEGVLRQSSNGNLGGIGKFPNHINLSF